ncbi:YrdB family protein [Psychromicrobium xiongbiense]|uniref:YrdB family protein n=1 Tax=Psychromicrobium xiongbiense TaxID=3051184 RepID=UPI0025532C85|nr:YrdB family protein [Psychromicrobium sp. YIM S02556]
MGALPVGRRRQRSNLKLAHGILAFALEVALLVATFFIAWKSLAFPWGLLLGILAVAVVVLLWGLYLAPKARRRLSWPLQPLAALLLFVVAGIGLISVGWPLFGIPLIIVAALSTGLEFWLGPGRPQS